MELEAARRARDALDNEVKAIEATEARLEAARAVFVAASDEEDGRHEERTRLRREIDRAAGRVAEAELRLVALAPEEGARERGQA